jgi:2-iminobutanoate/2-iminopropanoate deaminase
MTRRAIVTADAPAAIGPYSQGIVGVLGIAGSVDDVAGGGETRVGGSRLVFCSGQIGLDSASGELVEGCAAQAEQALRNLGAVLVAAGGGWEHVVKTTVFLADIGDFGVVNEVYARHMPDPPPARSTFAVGALPKGGLVEIEAIAILPAEPGPG